MGDAFLNELVKIAAAPAGQGRPADVDAIYKALKQANPNEPDDVLSLVAQHKANMMAQAGAPQAPAAGKPVSRRKILAGVTLPALALGALGVRVANMNVRKSTRARDGSIFDQTPESKGFSEPDRFRALRESHYDSGPREHVMPELPHSLKRMLRPELRDDPNADFDPESILQGHDPFGLMP